MKGFSCNNSYLKHLFVKSICDVLVLVCIPNQKYDINKNSYF